ncbi:MAG TPA: cupin domain-containing protein [Acidimicrobiia bacterium]|nr:cupin domain-containing protein [Acidimicrobiia bacterium]
MTEPFRTNLEEVPLVPGLKKEEGWVEMQVQFLIDQQKAGTDDFLLGWTVLPPGARHDRHRHRAADEFFVVLQGAGMIYTDDGREPSGKGDVVYTPRGHWHGFDNTGDEDVVLVWGWSGAGSLEATGYEADITE